MYVFICLFIYLWLCWVFVSVRGLSLVAASGGQSSSRCAGLSLRRPLLLRSTGSRRAGSVIVAHGPSCSAACGIFPEQGSNPCALHWQADSQPLRHQGSRWSHFWLLFISTPTWILLPLPSKYSHSLTTSQYSTKPPESNHQNLLTNSDFKYPDLFFSKSCSLFCWRRSWRGRQLWLNCQLDGAVWGSSPPPLGMYHRPTLPAQGAFPRMRPLREWGSVETIGTEYATETQSVYIDF